MPPEDHASPAAPASRPIAFNDDFRRTITHYLLDGIEPGELAAAVAAEHGIPVEPVRAEIDRALESPYVQGARRIADRAGKYEWVMQNHARLAAADPGAQHVPVYDRYDPRAFFADHYRAHRPAVYRGLIDHWPARERWSLDYVASVLGDREVRVQWNRDSTPNYETQSRDLATFRPFSEIAERLRSPEPSNDFYVTANNSAENAEPFAPLREDIGELPGLLAPGRAKDGFIWIGPRGTVTPWHHDLTNNLLLQVVGRKRVRMVASHDTPLMRNARHCFSAWGSADLLPGPATDGKPPVLEVTIGPGDALFIPVGWWHHVDGVDQTIGMSFTGFAWDNDFYSSYHSFCDL